MAMFANVANNLLGNGYSFMPGIPGTKLPGRYAQGRWNLPKQITEYRSRLPSEDEVAFWSTWPDASIILVLGEFSGVTAVDFDYDVDGLHDKILDFFPDSPYKKRGVKGFTAFYKYAPHHANLSFSQNGKSVIEILTTNKLTHLPPSIYGNNKEFSPDYDKSIRYSWLADRHIENVPASELPELPERAITAVRQLFHKAEAQIIVPQPLLESPSYAKIESALAYIDANCSYSQWINIGMAIHDALAESGMGLFEQWSSTSTGTYIKGEPSRHYKTFKRGSITVATLFKAAISAGWQNEKKATAVPVSVPTAPKLVVPELVHAITEWITDSAIYPQPPLALGAALPLLGTLMSHRFRTDTNIHPNLFTIGVADTGMGKEHPRSCVVRLLTRLKPHFGPFLGGAPRSDEALITLLHENNGVRLLQLDEFGKLLSAWTGRNSSSYSASILAKMMEAFSSSHTLMAGGSVVNRDGKSPPMYVHRPHLNLHGSTTPQALYAAISHQSVLDGFLNRFLVFSTNDFQLLPTSPKMDMEPPDALINKLVAISKFERLKNEGDPPNVITFTRTAKKFYEEIQINFRLELKRRMDACDPFKDLFARAGELTGKLCLIGHDINMGMIDLATVEWAHSVVNGSLKELLGQAADNMAENALERTKKDLLKLIARGGEAGMGLREIIINTLSLTERQREESLKDLVESHLLVKIDGRYYRCTN